MKIPKQARHEAKLFFRACQANGLLDETRVRQLVQRVLTEKPRYYLAILTHFLRLVKLDLERRTARVETVVPLNPEQQTRLQEQLGRQYGPGLQFAFRQTPSLIGGMRVQVGSDVYDGTLRARLNELEESF